MDQGEQKPKKSAKGSQGKLIMMGRRDKLPNWRGELYVALIQYGQKDEIRFDVVPDSTHPADVEFLPPVQNFTDKNEALKYFMDMDHNKDKWKK